MFAEPPGPDGTKDAELNSQLCADDDCALFHQLLNGKKLKDRSRRALLAAIEHSRNHDGAAVVLQIEPGVSGRPDVLYAGTPAIRDIILTAISTPTARDGRTSGR